MVKNHRTTKSAKSTKKARSAHNAIWEVAKPGLSVLILGIVYSILQSPGVMSQLKYTFDSQTGVFTNHSTWWIVLCIVVVAAMTVALGYWTWKIIKVVSQKPDKAKSSKRPDWQALASWSAVIPLMSLVFMASLMNIVVFWSWQYIGWQHITSHQDLGWYYGLIGTLGGAMTIIFVSLPFFLIFSLYFLSKSSLLKR